MAGTYDGRVDRASNRGNTARLFKGTDFPRHVMAANPCIADGGGARVDPLVVYANEVPGATQQFKYGAVRISIIFPEFAPVLFAGEYDGELLHGVPVREGRGVDTNSSIEIRVR